MSNIIRIVIYVLVGLFIGLFNGRGCGSSNVHSSGNATYVSTDACNISTNVSELEFTELAAWCIEQKKKK